METAGFPRPAVETPATTIEDRTAATGRGQEMTAGTGHHHAGYTMVMGQPFCVA